MKRTFRLCLIFLSFFFFGLFASESFAQKTPTFWISNLEGKRFDSRKQQEIPFIISFFFVDCIPCRKEIPQLHKLITTEFPDAPLLFIDPVSDDSRSYIREFADSLNIPQSFFYKDSLGNISSRFFEEGQMAFPTIVAVKNNRFLFRYSGLSEQIIEEIRQQL